MTHPSPLPHMLVESSVRQALLEDLGGLGDRTSDLTLPSDLMAEAHIVSRHGGVFCGADFIKTTASLVSDKLEVNLAVTDGAALEQGTIVATLTGSARAVFTAERVALNFAGHLSGIATATAQMVEAVRGTKAKIAATRKTLPGLRSAQKFAVMCGGGSPHRYCLSDGILIKDNHIAAHKSLEATIEAALTHRHHLESIVVEVDTLAQLEKALAYPVTGVLLDNMTPDLLRSAVAMIDGRCTAEASGGITLETARTVAETGVDVISCGWLTHSVKNIDLGLDVHYQA